MDFTQQQATNALNILIKASEGYLNAADELTKAFVLPEVRKAVVMMQELIGSMQEAKTDSEAEKPMKAATKG